MKNVLYQNTLFEKKEFEILDSKLRYKETKYGNEKEIFIPFESILPNKSSYVDKNYVLLGVSICFLLITIWIYNMRFEGRNNDNSSYFIWLFLSVITFLFYIITQKNFWKINLLDLNFIFIFKNEPSSKEAIDFIENLYVKRNVFLNEMYGDIDKNLQYEHQLSNIKWLRIMEVITKEEYEKKIDQLNEIYIKVKKIGF